MKEDNELPTTGFLRLNQVLKFIPVSKSTWWAGVKSGTYPKSYKLGSNITAWRAEDIKEIILTFPKNQNS
jgi:predicted DNA-binding transcriptional regulator AlpA